ncbi:unnamed protein product [Schistosoma mattheei]|uniref:Uncharacterized protein n=1 Tax=Schistosoma mattheei TaxID=31246 RepID=A0A183PH56_9TREM|nr:unnamed protein product [Schistosoma mattheei]
MRGRKANVWRFNRIPNQWCTWAIHSPDVLYRLSAQMPWYGQEWGEFAIPLQRLSHGHAYIASAWEVLLTAFSWQGCCLRN